MNTLVSSTFCIINILTDVLNGKYAILLHPSEILFIQKMIQNNPSIFTDVSTELNNILISKKITFLDLPNIIKIITSIYTNNIVVECKNMKIDLINIIHITVLGILHANVFDLTESITEELEMYVSELIVFGEPDKISKQVIL